MYIYIYTVHFIIRPIKRFSITRVYSYSDIIFQDHNKQVIYSTSQGFFHNSRNVMKETFIKCLTTSLHKYIKVSTFLQIRQIMGHFGVEYPFAVKQLDFSPSF